MTLFDLHWTCATAFDGSTKDSIASQRYVTPREFAVNNVTLRNVAPLYNSLDTIAKVQMAVIYPPYPPNSPHSPCRYSVFKLVYYLN